MFLSQFIIACVLLFAAGWLQWNEMRGWVDENFDTELDKAYLAKRTRSRRRVQIMMMICGVLVLSAAVAGPGRLFVAAWTTVAFVLMVILVLAFFDALRTQNYEKHKRREIRKSSLKNVES